MTNEEAIEYWEQFNAEIDDLYDACSDADRDVLVKQREIVEYTISALRQQECVGDVNKSLTLDELSERNAPVFLPIKDFPNGGYWCLCENGYIIPPSGHGFMAKERPNWVFYSRKPEDGAV